MNFDEVNDRHHTYSTQWDFIADRFGESDLLPFSISDTDFRSPDEVVDVCDRIVKRGIYGYTRWNHHDYKGAIKDYYQRRHNTDISEDWIVYSPSVIYTAAKLIEILTDEGDGICVFEPMYDAFYHLIENNHRKIISSRLVSHNGHYEIDFNDLEEKMKQAKLFLLCSPHNPTGRVWTEEELTHILQLCNTYHLPVISDEIHSDLIQKGYVHHPVLQFQTERTFLLSSASKTFNTPGLGGSYAVIPDQDIRERFEEQTRYKDFVNSASLLSVHALITAYNKCDYYIDELTEYVRRNFLLVKEFADTHEGISFTMPESTYLAWIDVSGLPCDDVQLQEALVKKGKVGIMNGKVYGDAHYLRMNVGAPASKVKEGLRRFDKALQYIQK